MQKERHTEKPKYTEKKIQSGNSAAIDGDYVFVEEGTGNHCCCRTHRVMKN